MIHCEYCHCDFETDEIDVKTVSVEGIWQSFWACPGCGCSINVEKVGNK